MTDATPPAVAHDFSHYLRPLRRHRALLALCLAACLLVSIVGALAIRPTYTSDARVQVVANITDLYGAQTNGRTNGVINMDTQAQLVGSLPVAKLAQQMMHTSTPLHTLQSRVTVSVPPNTTILRIAFAAHSAVVATAGANAFAAGYLQNRQAAAQTFLKQQVNAVNGQITAARNTLLENQAKANETPSDSVAHHNAEQKKTTAQTELTTLGTALGTLNSASTSPGTIVSAASTSGSSPNQRREIVVLAGLVLGVLLGIFAATARDNRDKSIRSEDDLTREGLPLITEIQPPKRAFGPRRATVRAAEALARTRAEQRLAATIGAALGEHGGSVYVAELSPAVEEDGFVQRLSAELSRFGSTTEIVTLGQPAHTSRPNDQVASGHAVPASSDPDGEPKALGWPTAPREIGTGNQLAASSPVVRADAAPAVRTEAASGEMSLIMHEVQAALARSRYVILRGPDTAYGSEAYVLASLSQVTALIVEPGVTTKAHLADVVDQVEVTSSRILGAMLWRRPAKRNRPTQAPAGWEAGDTAWADQPLPTGSWDEPSPPTTDDPALSGTVVPMASDKILGSVRRPRRSDPAR